MVASAGASVKLSWLSTSVIAAVWTWSGEIDTAAGVAEIGAAGGAVDLAELLLQGIDQAAELGLEAAVAGRGLAEPAAAQLDQPLAGIVPADQGQGDLGMVEGAGDEIALGDAIVVEHGRDLEAVGLEPGRAGDRGPLVAGAAPVGLAGMEQVPVVVGEAEGHPVLAGDREQGGQPGHLACEVRRKARRDGLHGRSSRTQMERQGARLRSSVSFRMKRDAPPHPGDRRADARDDRGTAEAQLLSDRSGKDDCREGQAARLDGQIGAQGQVNGRPATSGLARDDSWVILLDQEIPSHRPERSAVKSEPRSRPRRRP